MHVLSLDLVYATITLHFYYIATFTNISLRAGGAFYYTHVYPFALRLYALPAPEPLPLPLCPHPYCACAPSSHTD